MAKIRIRARVRLNVRRTVTVQRRVTIEQRAPVVRPAAPLPLPKPETSRALNNLKQATQAQLTKIRTNQQRISQALAKLQNFSASSQHTELRASVDALHASYLRLKQRSPREEPTSEQELMLDLAERENANNLEVMAALSDDGAEEKGDSDDLQTTIITSELTNISGDLHHSWQGALHALNPQNPEAARHFCTSVREIFTKILELMAPDEEVFSVIPDCQTTKDGKPKRDAKISFLLHKKGMRIEEFEEFT